MSSYSTKRESALPQKTAFSEEAAEAIIGYSVFRDLDWIFFGFSESGAARFNEIEFRKERWQVAVDLDGKITFSFDDDLASYFVQQKEVDKIVQCCANFGFDLRTLKGARAEDGNRILLFEGVAIKEALAASLEIEIDIETGEARISFSSSSGPLGDAGKPEGVLLNIYESPENVSPKQ